MPKRNVNLGIGLINIKYKTHPQTRVCTLLMLAEVGGLSASCSLNACEVEHCLDKL